MQKTAIATAVAAFGMMTLAACGDRQAADTAQTAPATAAAPAEPAPPPTPPPSLAAQHETALTGLGAKVTDKGLSVTLASADFPSGSAEFKPESTDRIDRVADLLKERDSLRLQIIGYTDDRGNERANERLSMQRADAVKQMIVSRGGIAADRVEAMGKGEADPVASNDTEDGRAQNRRVELLIVDEGGGYRSLNAFGAGGTAETPSLPATGG